MQLTLNIPYKNNQWQAHYQCQVDGVNAIGIKGRSGSGKTTLMRIIAGLETVATGELCVNNQQWLSPNKRVKPQSRNIAYVTQDSLLFPHLTIEKNLLLASKRGHLSLSEIDKILSLTGITPWLVKKPRELSGGQRQRVSLVQALIQTPKLLLCDEPLSALDAQSREHLIHVLKEFITCHQIPMIYISHSDKEIKALTDHCLVIENGKIVQSDDTINIFSKQESSSDKSGNVRHQPKTNLSFKTIAWHKDDSVMELRLIEGESSGVAKKAKQSDLSKPLYVSTPFSMSETIWTTSLLASEVFISRTSENDSTQAFSVENSLTGKLVQLTENSIDFTACIEASGNVFFASLSKRLTKKLALSLGESLTIYFSLRYEKGDNH